MNEFQFENKTYKFVPFEHTREITHAMLASGKIVDVYFSTVSHEKMCDYRQGIGISCWKDLGIKPLKLLGHVPVGFDETFELVDGSWRPIRFSPFGFASGYRPTKRFRCVEILEEDK